MEQTGEVEVIRGTTLINSPRTAKEEALKMVAAGVHGVIFSYGVFSFPNFTAIAARNLTVPVLLVANLNPDWPGMVAMLAGGGALNHLGIKHFRVAGDVNQPEVLERIMKFCRCARAVTSLNGKTYGLVGGRSLGMYSATVDMQTWQKLFGVDIEHIDQLEIVRLAEEVPEVKVEQAFQWLTDNVGRIEYDGKQLTPEKLKTQIRHYEAAKRLIRERNLDFVGVKCHYEMSRNYCTQCLSRLLQRSYDWDGPKSRLSSCEADSDGALTMEILRVLTDQPVIFMDVRHYDPEECDGLLQLVPSPRISPISLMIPRRTSKTSPSILR